MLDLWSAAHEQLIRGDGRSWRGFRNSKDVRDGLEGLEPHFVKMEDAARQVIRAGAGNRADLDTIRGQTAVILDNEAEYLRRMDRVVWLYEREARGRIDNLPMDQLGGHGLDPGGPRGDRRVHPPAGGRADPASGRRARAGA